MKKIKKQTTTPIFILMAFIFALVISMGAVSAVDNNTIDNAAESVSSDDLALIEISGQVEQCSDREPFMGATVTVYDNKTQIASTTTSADGTYSIGFQSMNRVFTVTANANGHKPSIQTVTVNNNQEPYTGTANFRLGNNDAYVYQGWTTNPDEDYNFSDGTTIHLTGATNAFTTINDGINYATGNPGVNTVYIAPGTYNEYSMSIDTSINLHGEDQATMIIDANDNARILTIWNDATVNIEQITFRDGSSEYGGAIRVESGTTTISDCTFDSNTVPDFGGAIYVDSGANLSVSGTTFTDNTAVDGGAIYNDGGVLNFNGCTFTGNQASSASFGGGAILNSINGGTVSLSDCIFSSNTARYGGGAIYNRYNLTVENCTFTSNTASSYGGAISAGRGTNTITGCTFSGNTASNGGAIAIGGGADTCTVKGCTLIGNSAATLGGAIYSQLIITANFNRFYSNQASQGSAISAPTTSNIENNWWGLNNPISSFPSLIQGVSAPTQWLFMTVSANPTTINNGGTSLITVSFNNYSSDGTTYTPFTPVGSNHIPDGTPLTFATTLGSIPGTVVNTVGGIATATFTASQTAGTAYISGLIDSYQTPYDPNDPNTTPYTTVTINKAANLTVTKTGPDTVIAGNQITYTITATNNGPDDATNVIISDTFPSGISNISWTAVYAGGASGPASGTGNLNMNIDTLPDGASCTITITGTVPSSTPSETILSNTVTLTTTSVNIIDPSTTTDTVTTTVNTESDIEISKTVDNVQPDVGDTVTFTVTVQNNGPSDATNIQIQDIMPSDFTDVVITPSHGTYDEGTGIWALNIANGESATLTLTGKVTSNMAGKNTTNTATLVATTETVNATVYVPKADLYIVITSNKNNPTVGETFTLTYKLGNRGPDTAENVTITIPIPEGFEILSITGDGNWTYDASARTITWTFDNVTVGDPYLYITGFVNHAGSYVFTASIASDTYTINTQGTPITINAINAATKVKSASHTIGMQKTGVPLAAVILAVLMLISGMLYSRKEQ